MRKAPRRRDRQYRPRHAAGDPRDYRGHSDPRISEGKDRAAVALGRKGGKARAAGLSARNVRKIARDAESETRQASRLVTRTTRLT